MVILALWYRADAGTCKLARLFSMQLSKMHRSPLVSMRMQELRGKALPHLCEELDTGLSIHVEISMEGASPAGEGEEGQRDWYRHIDTHLNNIRRRSAIRQARSYAITRQLGLLLRQKG